MPSGDRETAGLVEKLGHADWRVRKAAVDALSVRRSSGTVGTMVELLREHSDDERVLNGAVQILASSGHEAVEPVSALLLAPLPHVRLHAARTLGLLQDPNGGAALRRSLDDPDENVRFHVVEALGLLRDMAAVSDLLERLPRESDYLRFAIVESLGAIGDRRAVPDLIDMLGDESLRLAAMGALGEIADERPVRSLVGLLEQDNEEEVARAAAKALVAIQARFAACFGDSRNVVEMLRASASSGAVNRLIQRIDEGMDPVWLTLVAWLRPAGIRTRLKGLLHSESFRGRGRLLDLLPSLGQEVGLLMLEELDNRDPHMREIACLTLGRLGARHSLEKIVARLGDQEDEVRTAAAAALAQIGDASCLPLLLTHLDDQNARVRQTVVEAVNSIGSPQTLERVLPLLESDSPRARESAVQILGYFGFAEALEGVLRRIDDTDDGVRRAAIAALPYFDQNQELLDVLDAVRSSAAPRLRAEAVRAIGRMEGSEATVLLRASLVDSDSWVRYRACLALGERHAAGNLQLLLPLLRDSAVPVQIAACTALGKMGDAAAAQAIEALLANPDEEVRRAALAALASISAPSVDERLFEALGSPDAKTREVAIEGLSHFMGDRAVDALARAASEDSLDGLRQRAVHALGKIRSVTAMRALLKLVVAPYSREMALQAIGEAEFETVSLLMETARDRDLQLALAATEVLGRQRQARASDALAEFAEDERVDPSVRASAEEALRGLGRADLLDRGP